MSCSLALPLLAVRYYSIQLYKYMWQPNTWMSRYMMELLQEHSPGLPKINNSEQLFVIPVQDWSRLNLLEI